MAINIKQTDAQDKARPSWVDLGTIQGDVPTCFVLLKGEFPVCLGAILSLHDVRANVQGCAAKRVAGRPEKGWAWQEGLESG